MDRIGVDIERLGKFARQGHLPTARISTHELGDLEQLRPVVRSALLFARLNPWHRNSDVEVAEALREGREVAVGVGDTLGEARRVSDAVGEGVPDGEGQRTLRSTELPLSAT